MNSESSWIELNHPFRHSNECFYSLTEYSWEIMSSGSRFVSLSLRAYRHGVITDYFSAQFRENNKSGQTHLYRNPWQLVYLDGEETHFSG
jgi:hypothetical protein